MSHDSDTPDTGLPKFPVNVVPSRQIRNEDLASLLALYRRGETEPLIFGDANKPEAAIIPFSAFMRLMKHGHADHVREESAFQSELSRRIQDADARSAVGEPDDEVTVEELAEELGPIGRRWAEDQRDARSDRQDNDG
ncbi:hypothetical protein L3Q67_26830 [Saccharothrix sp. AJ9571]|nr:hypothetical protein L3Q67_26830 [Saccharothrix sp. AJ9571]